DELASKVAVEQQVRQKVGLAPRVPFGEPSHELAHDSVYPCPERGRRNELCAQYADVLRGTNQHRLQWSNPLAGRVPAPAVELLDESGPVPALAGVEDFVDAFEPVDIVVDSIEQ